MAIILAGIGFLLGVVPPSSGLAWLLLIPAVVLGIIGVTRAGKKKGTSIAAIIIGAVGWLVSIIVFVVSTAVGLGSALDVANNAPLPSKPDSSQEDAPAAPSVAGIGDTVTSGQGISFTVASVTCGLATVGESFLEETAKGQFCQVMFTIANGGDDSISLSSYDIKANIGDAEYETSSSNNKFGDEYFSTDINPGLSAVGVVYFDIPAGTVLSTVQYAGLLSFDDTLVVKVS